MKNRLTNRAESGFVYCTQCCINQDKDCVEQDCFKAILDRLAAYEDTGLSPEQVQELAQAKAEGRLVVLLCKVGDNVYFLLQELDGEWYVSSPHRITEIGTRGFWTSAFPLEKPNAMDDFTSWSEFGKTVFLTREAAEKALEVGGMTKAERMQVYEKYGGRCAYCGKKIEYKDMQVDHIRPHNGYYVPELEKIENMNPSCRRCNHYKRAHSLETYRQMLKTLHERTQKIYINKVAEDYGIIKVEPWDGKFYFEKIGGKEDV